MGDRGHRQPFELRGGVARDLAEGAVDAQEAEVGRGQRHPDRRLLEGGAEALLGLGEGGLGPHPLGDVAHRRVALDHGAGHRVAHHAHARLDPHRRVARPPHPMRHRDRRLAVARGAQHRGDAGGVVGVNEVDERASEQVFGLGAQQLPAGGRGVAQRARRREHADQVGRGLGEDLRALLGRAAGILGAVALGAPDRDQPERVALAATRLRAHDGDQQGQQPADEQRRDREALARGRLLERERPPAIAELDVALLRAAQPLGGLVALRDREARPLRQVLGYGRAHRLGRERREERAGRARRRRAGRAPRRRCRGASRRRRAGSRWRASRPSGSRPAGRRARRAAGPPRGSACRGPARRRRRSRSALGAPGRRRRRSARAPVRRRSAPAPPT